MLKLGFDIACVNGAYIFTILELVSSAVVDKNLSVYDLIIYHLFSITQSSACISD